MIHSFDWKVSFRNYGLFLWPEVAGTLPGDPHLAVLESEIAMRKYTRTHQWIEIAGETAALGITAYAARELGEIAFVELPDAGAPLRAGGCFAILESPKAAAEAITPVAGTIAEVNTALADNLLPLSTARVDTWIVRLAGIDPDSAANLLDGAEYAEYCRKANAN